MADALHVLVHVPKCAGRTIERHLEQHLGDRLWMPEKRSRNFPIDFLGRKYARTPTPELERVAAVSGHFIGRSIEDLFAGRRMIRSVILRDPMRHMLSWYNFRMMRYMNEGLRPFPFVLFMRSMPVDPVAYFLLGSWLELPWGRIAALSHAQKAALLDPVLASFDRVVDISEADDLASWHSRSLGIPEEATRVNTAEEWEERTGWQSLRLEDLSAREIEALRGRLQLDDYLWRRWALKEDIRFEPTARSGFLRGELLRPGYEVIRRAARRFGGAMPGQRRDAVTEE